MSYAIELYFDHDTEAAVHHAWRGIREAGLPSPMLDAGYRPHVSFAVYDSETLDVKDIQHRLASYAGAEVSLPVNMPNIGIFPTDEGVLYLGVTPTQELIGAHADFHKRFAAYAPELRPYYQVGSWVPHCTLAFGLSSKECAAVLPLCWRVPLPLQGQFRGIGIAKVSPVSSDLLYACEFSAR